MVVGPDFLLSCQYFVHIVLIMVPWGIMCSSERPETDMALTPLVQMAIHVYLIIWLLAVETVREDIH